MKVQRLLAAVLLTVFLLTGCTSLSLSDSDILAPPKAAGNRAEVQSLIEKDAGGTYTLIYPSSGAYKSGIIQHDLNGDGSDEAIALYTAADGTPRLLIAVLRGDSYELYGSTQLYSAGVTGLSFADCDADGTQETIIGFDAGSALGALQVCFAANGLENVTAAEGFSDSVIGDFDGNSSDDILLLTPPIENTPAQAKLLVCADGSFSEKSACEVDADVVSYISLRFDTISDGIDGAVADGRLDSGDYTTQLLYYDSAAHLLVNPLFMNSSYAQSVRSVAVTCTDIDDDGIVEIPQCSLMEYEKDEEPDTVCSAVRWSGYEPDLMALTPKEDAVLCERLDFMLEFDAAVISSLTARYTAENAVTLYSLSFKGSEPVVGNELLTVKRYEKNSYDSSLTAEAKLYETASYTYTYILSEGSPFTHEEIESGFRLIGAVEA